MTRRIAIYLFPGVEVLDFAGPFEVFTTANRVHARNTPGQAPPFDVVTLAGSDAPVRARAGLRVLADHTPETCPKIDVLLLPGGVVDEELRNAQLIEWLMSMSKSVELLASVCTGAFLLAKAGVLDGLAATTHWEDATDLANAFPRVRVVRDARWVDEGRVITSAGIAAGIDMSLHVVSRLAGAALAAATARQMDVPYRPEP